VNLVQPRKTEIGFVEWRASASVYCAVLLCVSPWLSAKPMGFSTQIVSASSGDRFKSGTQIRSLITRPLGITLQFLLSASIDIYRGSTVATPTR